MQTGTRVGDLNPHRTKPVFNRMKMELLAPAGDLEKLKIAILYGADAVYIAGRQFGLRSAADNFSDFEFGEAIRFAHQKRRKVYIALNAFLHERELQELPYFIETLDSLGPDGVICSDLGVVKTVQRHSNIPIHLSTQASVLNSPHARIWQQEGVKRIVAGREISLEEAAEIKRQTGIEIELFLHGSMCMSYSGHCNLSNYTAGRDSNRGGCIQNCRFAYRLFPANRAPQRAFFISSGDLCGIELLERFAELEINAVKIEGRMKSGLYIATTVRVYRRALDDILLGKRPDYRYCIEELKKIPHRNYTVGALETSAAGRSAHSGRDRASCRYEMAGTVLEVDPVGCRFAFWAKSRLIEGDTLEILPFREEPIGIVLTRMVNIEGKAVKVAQPNSIVWLEWRKGIEAHTVARIAKHRPCTTH